MGIRSGESYLGGLRDGRQVFFEGKVVEDVTREPVFRRGAAAVAQFYDFQNSDAVREIMTYQTPEGEVAGAAFLQPRSKEDLRRRVAAYAAWAEIHCGFLGRSPDYMNTLLSTLGDCERLFAGVDARFKGQARELYLKARRGDLCFTHTFVEPFKVAVSPKGEAGPEAEGRRQHITAKATKDGLCLNGARGLATLAPFADMNLDMATMPVSTEDGGPHIWAFVVPVGAKGVKWICRDLASREEAHFSSPLSGRADEMDCMAIYDNCLIPWENVFYYAPFARRADPKHWWLKLFTSGLQHQVIIRAVAKTRFMIGLAHLLAESSRVNQFINIQERIGEMVGFLRTMESFAMAAVEGAFEHPETGQVHPHLDVVSTAVTCWSQFHPKMINHLLDIGGGRYMSTPQEATIDALGESIEDYVRGAGASGRQNVALHRLAWDVAGSSWGVRQDLYEKFHFGDVTIRKVGDGMFYDKTDAIAMVRRLLDVPPTDKERFPVQTQQHTKDPQD